MNEMAVIEALTGTGPLTGAELVDKLDLEPLELWRLCTTSPTILVRRVGRRFLRLDRAVAGYARLSPSIRREFLTYTLIDLAGRQDRLERRAADLSMEIRSISSAKRRLAAQTVTTVVESLPTHTMLRERACFILAGDITYDMAHRVPRPERSTGKLVLGSDLDIVVVVGDDLDSTVLRALDDAIYQKKHFLLVSPSHREEIDYLIKDLATVRRQVSFDTFEHMVACKILAEGEYLHGSRDLFSLIQHLLSESHIIAKLAEMEEEAVGNRREAELTLSRGNGVKSGDPFLNLFYTSDESDEIY